MSGGSPELIVARRERVLDAMARRGIDALVLGRQDDTNYASGMPRLWTAGTRPFGAGCIVVGATRRTHVLSSWDAGMPESMTFADLYPLTWNPARMAESMASIDGLADASVIGVDEVSPSFARAAARFASGAEVVPADDLMAEVRRTKMPEEVDLIRRACAVAWRGADAVLAGDHRDAATALGAARLAMAAAGSTIPTSEPVVRRADDGWAIDLGVLVDDYEGGIGGRFRSGRRATPTDEGEAHLALVAACRPGTGHGDLTAAAGQDWEVRGVGMGFEQPLVDPRLGVSVVLEPDMVLSVRVGDTRDIVAVTDHDPVVLSAR